MIIHILSSGDIPHYFATLHNGKPNQRISGSMALATETPEPPYYAVIFSSVRTDTEQGYEITARRMVELAADQPGFLGIESAHSEIGITVSYWTDLDAIRQWKQNTEHLAAQKLGRQRWYKSFTVRIALVEREYSV